MIESLSTAQTRLPLASAKLFHLPSIRRYQQYLLLEYLAACRTNDKETGHKQVLGLSFYVHFSSRKLYQAHSTPNKPQLAALYS